MDQYTGKRMGNYDVMELVGKGGMAAVYKGHQTSMNRNVAIKIMAAQFGADDQFVQRFKNEARMIAQLEHAHVLPVYDFGEQEGVLYIVMRYLTGGTLGDRIPEGGMPIRDAASIFRQLASALDYAHRRGVIHRDLKPGNVMFDEQGSLFLTDFGIAKSIEQETNLTGTGGVVGTPTYMSPEQGLGEQLDARSDIYALGVMLFEMLAGRPPFTADNPMAVMLKHINDAPPSLRDIRPEISQAVEAVVMRSLAKEPSVRYSTALEMADALDEAVTTGAVPRVAAAFTEPESTLAGMTMPAKPVGGTMTAPVAGAAATTAQVGAAGAAVGTVPAMVMPAGAAIPVPQVGAVPDFIAVSFNGLSEQINKNQWIGQWLQAGLLSISTFVILSRLTANALPEILILSLLPGVLYGLLRAPTLGALVSYVLILVPLAAHAPALAVLWTVLVIIAGSRLNSREIMLTLVTIIAAGNPLGWIMPLLAPWWLKARRTVLPMALGVIYATLFALTLGWPNAGRLLPVAGSSSDLISQAQMTPFDTTYFGLFKPDAWSAWTGGDQNNPVGVVDSVRATFGGIGKAFSDTGGLPLVIATAWALAAILSVSNQHSENIMLRSLGLALALAFLLVTHLVLRASAGVLLPTVPAIAMAIASAILAFVLSQWPLQADPNKGNKIGTVLRMFRQTMGALFMALGVAFFARLLVGSQWYDVFWIGGIAGTLAMITNPLIGPPLVYGSLVVGLVSINPTMMIAVAVLLFGYLIVNMLFDKRRPRTWNPLGAGFILGSPGMALAGLLPLGPLSIGALEAQVPAAIMAAMGHVLLVATAKEIQPFPLVMQLVTTLFGVLLVERVMATPLLANRINNRIRRMIFTTALAFVMALSYYGVARVETTVGSIASLPVAIVASVLSAAALVAAMGRRAEFWREFVEKEESEAEEFEDEEVTGTPRKVPAAATK